MEHIEYVYTTGMTESEVDERLRESEAGLLALAKEGVAYAVPVSYHYDGASIYFRLSDDDRSEKLEFVESTERACFVLFGVEKSEASWSIVVTGVLRAFPDTEEEEYDPAVLNDRFGPLRVFGEAIDEIELVLFEMRIEGITGRRTTNYRD